MAQVVSYHPVTAETQFNPSQVHMGFMADEVAVLQIFFS